MVPYVTGQQLIDLRGECGLDDVNVANTLVAAASDVVFRMLGAIFVPPTQVTVRPVGQYRPPDPLQFPLGSFYSIPPFSGPYYDGLFDGPDGSPTGFQDRISLQAPVVSVDTVKVDGAVLPSTAWKSDQYSIFRIDNGRWPRAQNLGLDDTNVGTFSIQYTFGTVPPGLIITATLDMAAEMWRDSQDGELIDAVRSRSTQGTSYSYEDTTIERTQGPALTSLMAAIASYNDYEARVSSWAWVPDPEWVLVAA